MARGGDPGRAARARPLGRGPVGRLLDVRRLAVVAGDAGGRDVRHRARAAPGRPGPGRPLQLLPPLRVRRRLRHARGAGAEVLAGLVRGRRAPGPERPRVRPAGLGVAWRGVRDLPRAHPGPVARVRLRARLLPGAGAGARRGAGVRAGGGAGDGGRAGPARGRAAGQAAGGADQAQPHARRRRPRAGAGARRAHRRGAGRGRLRRRRDRRAARPGAVAGCAETVRGSFMSS